MKVLKYSFIFLVIFLMYNCTASREMQTSNSSQMLTQKINSAIKESGLKPKMGIKVKSLNSGKTLYSLNSDHLFIPASNNKIYTASAALHYLSPQFRFETSVWIDSTQQNSDHVPRLVLVGGGDPDIFLRELESIAKEINKSVKSIDTIIIDNSLFDDTQLGPGWMWDEGSGWYAAPVDALSFNDNCIDITTTPGPIGEKPLVTINPPTNYVEIRNEAVTVSDTIDFIGFDIERRWWGKNNIFDIEGEIFYTEGEDVYFRNVENPALYTGTVFAELLSKYGTEVKTVVIEGEKSENMIPLYTYYSEPLASSVTNFLKTSDNLSGELFVKMIGHATTFEQGNWDNGMHAIKTFLNDEVKIDTTLMRIVDGSGLSRYNSTSPNQFTQLLEYMYSNYTINAEFLSALPTGGWDGTLKNRMDAIEEDRGIRAKTGTMSGVSCLSGYAYTENGEPLVFSILMNGYVGSSAPYRNLQDRICEILININ
jgi:D-alanyl-D-alanine carboxypeptidase/D-alanyl-D-alanine-endopeptidase (penicillin-binding protein 4)